MKTVHSVSASSWSPGRWSVPAMLFVALLGWTGGAARVAAQVNWVGHVTGNSITNPAAWDGGVVPNLTAGTTTVNILTSP